MKRDTNLNIRRIVAGWFLPGVAILCLSACAGFADAFPDDHGDDAGTASGLSIGVQNGGTIEQFLDHDFWQFTVQDDMQYSVTVTPTTLDDGTVRLLGPDGVAVLVVSNSVGNGAATFEYAHVSGPFDLYVDVGGFVEFTTGVYTIQVQEGPITDIDLDGMADVWEQQNFGDLGHDGGGNQDGDDVNDLGEYLAGTNPNLAGDSLVVTACEQVGQQRHLSWRSAPVRYYDVSISHDLGGAVWAPIGTKSSTSTNTTFVDNALIPSNIFYRVELSP